MNKLFDEFIIDRAIPKSGLFRSAYDSERPMLINDSIDVSKRIIWKNYMKING